MKPKVLRIYTKPSSSRSLSVLFLFSSPLSDGVSRHSPLPFTHSLLAFQPSCGDQSGMGTMSSGLGLGYDRGQYASGHGPQHGMRRQKSIGEAVCFFCLPLLSPVCLSSGPVEVHNVLTCLWPVCGQYVSSLTKHVHTLCL